MKKRILSVALLSTMSSAYAMDVTVDTRSLAMGGAGVASANGYNTAFQNPARLADLPKEKFTLQFPFAFRLLDEGDLSNGIDNLNTSANAMSSALNTFSTTPSGASATNAGTAVNNFNNSLSAVNSKAMMGNFYGGALLAIPGPRLGFALKLDVRTEFGATIDYSSADQTTMTNLSTNLTNCGGGNGAACTTAQGQTSGGDVNGLTSSFLVRGAVLGELGLGFARHFEGLGGIDLGITPKFIKVTTFDTNSSVQSGNASATSTNGNQKSENVFSADVGASKRYATASGKTVVTGVVVKNLISKTLKTALGNSIQIAPQVTAGASYGTDWFTGTADFDLIKNKALIKDLTKESQFMRLGAEFDAKGWAQLRVGYRHDLAGNYAGMPSVGLGLNLKLVNLDLSVASAGKKELAAALQIGTHF